MSIAQFAMVEELASLVKDNLPCKYLVLSVEAALVNYLQDDSSQDGIIELEPMNPYNRLLLHRLADIFGFDHQSVGEGDDRHLVLERCTETSIPSILVSDILWHEDTSQPATTLPLLLKRHESSVVLKMKHPSPPITLEEREEAYLAARERIFAMNSELKEAVRQKPRHDPVVARRMIAHALGKRINESSLPNCSEESGKNQNGSDSSSEAPQSTIRCSDENISAVDTKRNGRDCSAPSHATKETHKLLDKRSPGVGMRPSGRDGSDVSKSDARVENLGAARRMFAHALGIHAARDGLTRNRQVKAVAE
ncbi:hypothetical protein Dimus_011906 [Dionaea muscipula]